MIINLKNGQTGIVMYKVSMLDINTKPRPQGLSSLPPLSAEKRDPGNEVDKYPIKSNVNFKQLS